MLTLRELSRCVMTKLSTIDDVLEGVGGIAAARSLAGIKPDSSAPFNWKVAGRIPTAHFLVFTAALREAGKEADPALFGFTQPDEVGA